jgi:hypothetical protein
MSGNNSGNQTFTRVVNAAAPLDTLQVSTVVASRVITPGVQQVVGYLPVEASTGASGSIWNLLTSPGLNKQTSGSAPYSNVVLLPKNAVITSVISLGNLAGPTSIDIGTQSWLLAPTSVSTIANNMPSATFVAGVVGSLSTNFADVGTALVAVGADTSAVVVTLNAAAATAGTLKFVINYIV